MESEPIVKPSIQELAYRSKHYHDLRAIERRELHCASCGNVLSQEFLKIFSHKIFGILQCESCKFSCKNVNSNESDSKSSCSICGRKRECTYECANRDCRYIFCKHCIKRNAPQSLLSANAEDWRCFACDSKPLWKLRGACAAVMASLPKRTKANKVSRNTSSESEDPERKLTKISHVGRSNRAVEVDESSKRLETRTVAMRENRFPTKSTAEIGRNAPRLISGKSSSRNASVAGSAASDATSDESSEAETRKRGKSKKSKFKSSKGTKELRNKKKTQESDSESSKSTNRKGMDDASIIIDLDAITEEESSSGNEESTKSATREARVKKKTVKIVENDSSTGGLSKESKRNTKRSSHFVDEGGSVSPKRSSEQSVESGRSRTDKNKGVTQEKSSKSLTHRRKNKNNKDGSDSSSGKEFQRSKVLRNSCIDLRKNSRDLEADCTSPDEDDDEDGQVSKDDAFALKNRVRIYLTELRSVATKLLRDVEEAQKDNSVEKENISIKDATRMVRTSKKAVRSLRNRLEEQENNLKDYYSSWRKKTRASNVSKKSNSENTESSSRLKRNSSAAAGEKSSSVQELSDEEESVVPTDAKTVATSSIDPKVALENGDDVDRVSGCDSDEIFSADDSRTSLKTTEKSKTKNSEDTDKKETTKTRKTRSKARGASISSSKSDEVHAEEDAKANKQSDSSDIEVQKKQRDADETMDISLSPPLDSPPPAEENKSSSTSILGSVMEEEPAVDPLSKSLDDIFETSKSSDDEEKDENRSADKVDKSENNSSLKLKNIEATQQKKLDACDAGTESTIMNLEKSATSKKVDSEDSEDSITEKISNPKIVNDEGNSTDLLSDADLPIAVSIDNTSTEKEDREPRIADTDKSLKEKKTKKSKKSKKNDETEQVSPASPSVESSKTLEADDESTAQVQPETEHNEEHQSESNEISRDNKKRPASSEVKISGDSIASRKDRDKRKKKTSSKSRSPNDSGTSSEFSLSENLQAKEALLMTSNSDDDSSSSYQESQENHQNTEESNGTVQSGSEIAEKVKEKRKKFRIGENRHYKENEQLKKACQVRVERLEENILEQHTRALNKSRDYLSKVKEAKELKSLLKLNKLDKKYKQSATTTANSSDEDGTSVSSKDLRAKKKRAKEPEETLLDHLRKVENGDNTELNSESDMDTTSGSGSKLKPSDQSEDGALSEANRMAKKRLLESSDSGGEPELPTAAPEESKGNTEDVDEEDKKPKKKSSDKKKSNPSEKSSEDEEKKQEKYEKGRWRRNKILTLRISDTDSEEDNRKWNKLQAKVSEKKNDGSQSDSGDEERRGKKKRVRRRILHSDSDVVLSSANSSDSEVDRREKGAKKKKKNKTSDDDDDAEGKSDEDVKKKSRKRTRRSERRSSDSSSSTEEKRPKPSRRKRIKTAGTDSDSNDQDNSQGTPGKSGRKNIRKVLRDKQVAEDTKQAAKEEEERLKRIADRQKLYNEMYEVRLAGEEKVDKLVLDFDEETKEPLVSVDEGLVKRLKPHQARGIKFMWDACFESLERTKTTKGSGCILAHCMGLGKSFQIVTLVHTLLTHKETGMKTVLVVCPLSTVLNWVNEFKIWLADLEDGDDIEVYELTKMKKHFERKYLLERWRETGGVMIIGYEMFRNLSNTTKKVRKNIQQSFLKCLVDPGPDLIVCDEGHLLKKEDTALSKAMRRVTTLRRIVLTGTPLQNNLIEYHCMVQFVKPNLLGTKKEFMNRFENPITNGQFDDSTEYDVKLMKKRAHVLHKMLEGSVQRFDYSVLMPFLPPKQEYVIFVKLTEVQIKMYQHYLDNYARRHRGVGGSLFADFQALQRIWTHPMVMRMNAEKVERANEKKRLDATDSEGSLRDFIDDDSDTGSTSESSDARSVVDISDDDGGGGGKTKKKVRRGTRANPVEEEPPPAPEETAAGNENDEDIEWWTQYVKPEDYEDLRISSKLLLLFRILKESDHIGDKVLVFSQSLYSLTLIERFLGMIDEETQRNNSPENLDGHSGSWCLGLDYFRLDGQTSTDNRRRWCDIFNKPSNTRARLFLISTRAGGLGINLTAANRVIIFDASWNPSHDVQSIFRIYRFGQKKPCYVYRLLAAGTMEEKIYNRQVTKLSLSCRVVDEQQIERHYTNNALAELYKLELPTENSESTTLNLPKDRLLAEIFSKYKHAVENYHEHDSLLENQAGEELDEEERKQAWLEYEEEKKGKRMLPPPMFPSYQNDILMQQINMMNLAKQNTMGNPMADYSNLQLLIEKDYPGLTDEQKKIMTSRAIVEMYNYLEKQAMTNQNFGMPSSIGGIGTNTSVYDNRMLQPMMNPAPSNVDTMRMYHQGVSQSNGQTTNYTNKSIHVSGDPLALPRQQNHPVAQTSQMHRQLTSAPVISLIADDDIMEIPQSHEKNSAPSGSTPSGSRKSQEE